MTLTNEQFNKTTSEWPDWPSSRHVTSISKQPNIPTIQQSISTFSSRSAEKRGPDGVRYVGSGPASTYDVRRQIRGGSDHLSVCTCTLLHCLPRCCVSWPGENLQPDGIHHRHRPRPTVQPFGIQHNCLLLGCPYTDGATVSDVHFNQSPLVNSRPSAAFIFRNSTPSLLV